MNERVFIHVDINSAYCSMEAFWNPELANKAIVVLSSNDGNIIARNAEAKKLKIPMGVPVFQVQDIIHANNVAVLSSNFALYGEMSRRFHSILAKYVAPESYYIYSIDEAFLEITDYMMLYDVSLLANELKTKIKKYIGLDTCVGAGRSLTEAKLANHLAKKKAEFNGICNLISMDPLDVEQLYLNMDVSEVWGIGSKYSKKLHAMGIATVLDLASANPNRMRDLFNVNIQSTILELQGNSCFPFESAPKAKQQIISSKSFGQKVTELVLLQEAISKYAQNALSRLHSEKALCGTIIVFLQSNPFDRSKPYFNKSMTFSFPEPTDSILEVVKMATVLIEDMYKPDIEFKKCGIMLCDLIAEKHRTNDLLTDLSLIEKNDSLKKTYIEIQSKFGRNKIAAGSCNMKNRLWAPKSERASRNYFTEEGMIVFN